MTAMTIDVTKGFDVMRGKKVVEHFDSYAAAWEYAVKQHLTVRYWAVQPAAAATAAE